MSRNSTRRKGLKVPPKTVHGKPSGKPVLANFADPGSGGKPKYRSVVNNAQIADMAQSMELCLESKGNGKKKKNKFGGRSKKQGPASDVLIHAQELSGTFLGGSNRNQSGGFGAMGAWTTLQRERELLRRRDEMKKQNRPSNKSPIDVDAKLQATKVAAKVPRRRKTFAAAEPYPLGNSMYSDFSNPSPLDNYFLSNGDDEQAAKLVTVSATRKSKTPASTERVKQARSKNPEHFDIESEIDNYMNICSHGGDNDDDISLPVSKAVSLPKKRPSDSKHRYKTTPNQRRAADPPGRRMCNDVYIVSPLDRSMEDSDLDEQTTKVTARIARKSEKVASESEVDNYMRCSDHGGDNEDDFSLPISKALSPQKKRPSDLNRYRKTPNQRQAATATPSRHFSSTTRDSTQASQTIDVCNGNESEHSAIPLKKVVNDQTPHYFSVGSSVETTMKDTSPPSGDYVRNFVQSIGKDKSKVYVEKVMKFSLSQQARGESSGIFDHDDTSSSNYNSLVDTPPQKKTLLGSLKSTLQSGVNAVIDYVPPSNSSGEKTVRPSVIARAENMRRRGKGTAIQLGGTLEKSTTATTSARITRSASKRKGWLDWSADQENDALSPSRKTKRNKRTNSTSKQPIDLVDSPDEEEVP